MGSGTYSSTSRTIRAQSLGYYTKSAGDIFTERTLNVEMSPKDVGVRESRDSAEHPESQAIIIALDVTGSMRRIPHMMVKDGLPNMMERLITSGIQHPQVMFLAIGDHEWDSVPLQVGQFESSDELLDKWLTKIYLEGGGGGNDGESYMLAWYFAAHHTSIDCWEKRKQKGLLVTIGDEPFLKSLPAKTLKGIMGTGEYRPMTAFDLVEEASKTYDIHHIHIRQGTGNGMDSSVPARWKQLLGNGLHTVDDHTEIPGLIAKISIEHFKSSPVAITAGSAVASEEML